MNTINEHASLKYVMRLPANHDGVVATVVMSEPNEPTATCYPIDMNCLTGLGFIDAFVSELSTNGWRSASVTSAR
jgi:hypothetical protein